MDSLHSFLVLCIFFNPIIKTFYSQTQMSRKTGFKIQNRTFTHVKFYQEWRIRIQARNTQLLRCQVHNNLMTNKPEVWKINNTQYLTWFVSTIEPTFMERNPFFNMREKPYIRIQFEPKSNLCIPSLISQEPSLTPMYKATCCPFVLLVCLFVVCQPTYL